MSWCSLFAVIVFSTFIVALSAPIEYAYGDIRLVDGPSSREGRLELFDGTQWGTVCDDGFSDSEAQVVCRQLGYWYSSAVAEVRRNAYYGYASGRIVLDKVDCEGDEIRLLYCDHSRLGQSDCSHSKDVGVKCSNNTFPTI
ncbi:neurotrypsin-like [Corticium candelabrum]|uniref:neurotrypsin-like n=1 Tax=Corticium candelabrum TaxID=121492 RepID=UPI002E34FAF8|nr:neurotrypsin-like [Corticium candelabrum]